MDQLGNAILIMIFLRWFGFPWSVGILGVFAALGFPPWLLLLWLVGACSLPVVRAVRFERECQRADREQAALGLQTWNDGRWNDDGPV